VFGLNAATIHAYKLDEIIAGFYRCYKGSSCAKLDKYININLVRIK